MDLSLKPDLGHSIVAILGRLVQCSFGAIGQVSANGKLDKKGVGEAEVNGLSGASEGLSQISLIRER